MNMRQGLYGLNEPALPERPKPRWWKFFKFILAFIVLIMGSLTALHMAGGSNATLKKTVETYLSQATGYGAHIEKLNAVSFYPLIGIDMEDVSFETPSRVVVARVSHINFSTSFWSASSGADIHTLDIRDAAIDAGAFTPGKIDIRHFSIDTDDKKSPKLVFKGSYDDKAVNITTDLKIVPGIFGEPYFIFSDNSHFELEAGEIHATGIMVNDFAGRSYKIDRFSAGKGLKPVQIDLAFGNAGEGMNLQLKIGTGDSVVDHKLVFSREKERRKITGTIRAEKLNFDDLLNAGGMFDQYAALNKFYMAGTEPAKDRGFDFSNADLNVDIKIDHLMKAGIDLGSVDATAQTKDNVLSIEPIKGIIKDGSLEGKITLDAKLKPAALAIVATVKQMDYTSLTTMLDEADDKRGRADLKLELGAAGDSGDALWANLNGKMTVVAGPGGLKSPLINLWGGGLVNTMLPALKGHEGIRLNCGIGDFTIQNGMAKTKTLFLDTDRVTVVGDGSINLARSTINMKLEPQSKNTAFFSAATAVNVTGKINHPSIEPDAFSLGKKLGGLLLGTINPVYLAFSLTDLGEDDSHPCRAYIKK